MRVAIIGAGPIGLYFASLCEKTNIDYTVFEANSEVGGQITNLYPSKIITNIPNEPAIIASEYINNLFSKINPRKILFNTKIFSLEGLCDTFDYIIVATGLGNSQPRKLGVANEDNYNILYSLNNYDFLQNKKVVIFGGGDSALDWAKQLSEISDVALVHRREEFRGNAKTIEGCNLTTYLSYVPEAVQGDKIKIKSVKSGEFLELPYDYILVNFGQELVMTAFEDFPNTYYIGDATGSRTIADGISQAQAVFTKIIGDWWMDQRKTVKNKCSFCKYATPRGCMVTPNSYYCREASDEYYQYLHNNKTQVTQKSFRPWDKK